MPAAERPTDETERLRTLLGYGILDTPREEDYDDLVVLASTICGAPTSLITLIDDDRQWFKAHLTPMGDAFPRESPREISFCAHAILQPDELTVVDDLARDIRFADNPLVAGGAGVRFYAAAPLVAQGHAVGTICVADTTPREGLTDEQALALKALSRQVVAQLELRRSLALVTDLADRHRTLAESDPLTGLYNRRFFEMEMRRRLTQGGSGALMIIDLNGFKRVNDEFGHGAGDRVLGTVAERITTCMRAEDFVARLGGDEFAVGLGRIGDADAATVAERLYEAIAAPLAGYEIAPVTASIGLAMFDRGGDLDSLLQRADQSMYAHKRGTPAAG